MFIRYALYRRLRVWAGARSFVLKKDGQMDTYILINGTWGNIPNNLISAGYVEEFVKCPK